MGSKRGYRQAGARKELEGAGRTKQGEEGGPTFGRRRGLSVRGFRARFLRSVISGGPHGRFWNIHSEPLRMAASPRPSVDLGRNSAAVSFGAKNHSAWDPDGWNVTVW